MNDDEEAAILAVKTFYEAIEALVSGRGPTAMSDAWHHDAFVTSGHPSGEWARGWDEVWATWTVFASYGAPDRGGSHVRDIRAHVCGDMAYTTCLFQASQAFGGDTLACTNVLERRNGVWKVTHHHADKSPAMGAALEKLFASD